VGALPSGRMKNGGPITIAVNQTKDVNKLSVMLEHAKAVMPNAQKRVKRGGGTVIWEIRNQKKVRKRTDAITKTRPGVRPWGSAITTGRHNVPLRALLQMIARLYSLQLALSRAGALPLGRRKTGQPITIAVNQTKDVK